MATNKISLDTGSTIHTGTYVITESALQVNIPRSTLNDSAGAEIGITTNPLYVITSGGTLGVITITGNTVVLNTVAVTGSVTIANATPISVTGSTVVVSLPAITGSVAVVNAELTVTGNTAVINTVTVTGSTVPTSVVGTAGTTVVNVQGNTIGIPVNVTGSTAVVNTVAITGSTTIANATPISITGSTTIANASLTITGSTTLVGTSTITGSTSVVNTVTVTGTTTSYNPTTATISVLTTANTNVILIPSHATLGIRIKSVVVSVNTGGTVSIAETSTLTTGNLKIGTLHLAANGGMALDYSLPLECTATTNVVYTTGTATSTSITAQYYYA